MEWQNDKRVTRNNTKHYPSRIRKKPVGPDGNEELSW